MFRRGLVSLSVSSSIHDLHRDTQLWALPHTCTAVLLPRNIVTNTPNSGPEVVVNFRLIVGDS